MLKGIAALVFSVVATNATFAQWNGPSASGQPNTQDISDGMQALSGVAVPAQPVGTALPCKCCGAAVSAKYITTSYPQERETDLLMAYMVFWQINIAPGPTVYAPYDNYSYTPWVSNLSLVCEYTPVGDWSVVPASAIPPLALGPVTYPYNPTPSQVTPSNESWIPDARNYLGTAENGSINFTCNVPLGVEISPESIPNYPHFTTPTGHNFTWQTGYENYTWMTGTFLGYSPGYRGLVKIHVKYTVPVQYQRWALVCGAGHDQSLPCDGTGGLGTAVPDQSTQTSAANNLAGDYFGQPGYVVPPSYGDEGEGE